MKIVNLAEKPEFLKKVSRWHHDEWGYLNPGRSFEMRLNDMQQHLAQQSIPQTWLALEDDVLGSAAIVESDMDDRPELTPWLASVFVPESARHKGIGRTLVQKVMQHAKEIGIGRLYLYTPDRAHFYAHMGWQITEQCKYHGTDVTIMHIDL